MAGDSGRPPEGGDSPDPDTLLTPLEEAVDGLLGRLEALEGELREAGERAREAEELVRRFTDDETEAGRLLSRLRALEDENEQLRSRLGDGKEVVERLLSKIRFLEEQR